MRATVRAHLGLLILAGILGGAAVLPAAANAGGRPAAVDLDALDAAAIDRFIAGQMASQRVPGLALAIIDGETVRYLKGYGAADGRPVTPQTQFHIASLSKSFTAVAVMQLAEAGRIDLDAPVQRYLPDFTLADPAAAAEITVRQLLNQVSGLADAGVPDLRLARPATSADRIASLANARTTAPPGSKYQYTDVNYQILGRVVEVAGGQSLSAYLAEHIFAPLAMAHTVNVMSSFEVPEKAGGLAQGHLLAFGIPVASPEERGYLGGSGGVISTAAGMANYLVMQANRGAFQGRQILSPASVALLHTPPSGVRSDYAMGWISHTVDGRRVLEHNGILSTFYAEMVLLPDTNQGFVLLYNIHSLAQDALGFPGFKNGLIALLAGAEPAGGGFNVALFSAALAVVSLLTFVLGVRALRRLPRWRARAASQPRWRQVPGTLAAFLPAALVIAMPALTVSTSGRAFGYLSLYRSMLEIMTWLALWGVLSGLNGAAHLAWLIRPSRHEPHA